MQKYEPRIKKKKRSTSADGHDSPKHKGKSKSGIPAKSINLDQMFQKQF